MSVARVRVEAVRAVAHRHGATVNDVVLTATAAALHTCLERLGEQVDAIVVGVPVAIRRTATVRELGNRLGEIRAAIPTFGDPAERLERVTNVMRERKQAAIGLSAVSAVVRAIAPLGVYDRYLRRQRYLRTIVTNLPGPTQSMTFCGTRIADDLPLAAGGGGNLTVTFAALSYAGTLAITVTADPDEMPDLFDTTTALHAELDTLTAVESSRLASQHLGD